MLKANWFGLTKKLIAVTALVIGSVWFGACCDPNTMDPCSLRCNECDGKFNECVAAAGSQFSYNDCVAKWQQCKGCCIPPSTGGGGGEGGGDEGPPQI